MGIASCHYGFPGESWDHLRQQLILPVGNGSIDGLKQVKRLEHLFHEAASMLPFREAQEEVIQNVYDSIVLQIGQKFIEALLQASDLCVLRLSDVIDPDMNVVFELGHASRDLFSDEEIPGPVWTLVQEIQA